MDNISKRTVFLVGDTQRAYAKRLIDQAPTGWVVKLAEQTRSDAQNRMMWPMIDDLRCQVPEFAAFSAEDMKLRFLNALGTEMHFLPALEGTGMFPVGQRSSTLSKSQFTALIELMFMAGAHRGVEWSHKSLDSYENCRTA